MAGGSELDVRRRAGWIPAEQQDLEDWIEGHCDRVSQGDARPLHPTLTDLATLVGSDPVLRMYADQMIQEVPRTRSYRKRHVQSFDHLLRLINEVLTMAPEYSTDSMVMTPIGAIVDWTSATPAGFAFYRDPRVNQALHRILDAWCEFLSGPDSRYVLSDADNGWRSPSAADAVGMSQFEHDPDDQYWGFSSWNDFFTRRFKPGARPVAAPDDDSVIVNACESTPYGIATDVQLRDRFWIKSQPYSLHDMLAGDESTERFVGGTVYQAFLSAIDYHRWHSPVSGTVIRTTLVPGTYFSEADSEGSDAAEPQNSQSYLAHVATRALILLRADNPAIGMVAFVPVGMVEVSSCIIGSHVTPGAHVDKGDELGYFQFGGSTYCAVFEPGVIDNFALTAIPQPHLEAPPLMKLGAALATVIPS